MAEEAWWKKGITWVKRQYQVTPTRDEAPASHDPVEHELVAGQLKVNVMKIWPKSGPREIPCWAFVSRGLRRHGHPEVAFFLEQLEGERSYPNETLRLFEVIDQFIASGRHFNVGDVIELPKSPFPGFHLACIPPAAISRNHVAPSTLCAYLVTTEEVAAIREYGCTRVMARLGEASRFFPCPFWSDRSRTGLSFANFRETSVLSKVARLKMPGARVHLDGNQVFLRLPHGIGSNMANLLAEKPPHQPIALLTELDPDGDGCLVWKPGQTEPAAITPDYSAGARISACFLLFGPDPKHSGATAIEDGYALSLPHHAVSSFREAIANESRLILGPSDLRSSFVMEWYDAQGPARSGLDVYEVFGTYPNADARRLLDAFVANEIDFTLNAEEMGLRNLSAGLAAHGGDFGNSAGITIGVQVDDWERAVILRQRVLKILA